MRVFVITIIIFINFILTITLFDWIEIMGVIPNTALIIVVSYAILRDDVEGAIVGFCAGLLIDLLFGRMLGISAFLLMMVGFLCGKPFRDFYKENYVVPVGMVMLMSLGYEFFYYILTFLLQGGTDFFRYFATIILPTTVYNIILSIFIYRIIYGINRRLERRIERTSGFK
ncbi:MAG: rod shape-determining protein MreD [Defluviitaleaceae bacterium]|nr:rod shape-determining protein MreD [Defluviitaleaceae bacterium]